VVAGLLVTIAPFFCYICVMATFLDLLNNIRSFDRIEAAGIAMAEHEQQILDINRSQLYDKGVGNDGQPLPAYTEAYARRKPTRGIVDIYASGKLQQEMELFVQDNEYTIQSKVKYSPYVAAVRPKIYGLTDEGKTAARVVIAPTYIELFRWHTGL